MKKDNKKIRSILLIVFAFLTAILFLIIFMYYNLSQNSNDKDYENVVKKVNEQYKEQGKIVPENYNFLIRLYEGDVQSDEIYSKIYNLVYKVIPDIKNNLENLSNEEIKKYYEKNKEEIISVMGIDDFENYLLLVQKVCKLENIEYNNCEFDVKNYVYNENEDYSKVNLKIKFSSSISVELNIKNKVEENKESIVIVAK